MIRASIYELTLLPFMHKKPKLTAQTEMTAHCRVFMSLKVSVTPSQTSKNHLVNENAARIAVCIMNLQGFEVSEFQGAGPIRGYGAGAPNQKTVGREWRWVVTESVIRKSELQQANCHTFQPSQSSDPNSVNKDAESKGKDEGKAKGMPGERLDLREVARQI